MTYYPYARNGSLDRLDKSYPQDKNSEVTLEDMDSISNSSSNERTNAFVLFVFILDLLVLTFVAVLEYFLRATEVFPFRQVKFNCSDASIAYKTGDTTYRKFSYNANISFEILLSLTFCIPPFTILIGELALWAFTEEEQKTVLMLCRQCKLPQVLRRLLRFIGVFVFGLLLTMIITDITKIMTGQLRPNFLEICQIKSQQQCQELNDDSICGETNEAKLRDARTSFPSMHASTTGFASTYIAIYLHNAIRAHAVRLMKPFLALISIVLSLLCGLARYGLYLSHWYDIVVGWLIGIPLAIYISVFVLNCFKENMTSRKLYSRLRNFFAEQRAHELRELYKENWDNLDRNSYFGIPSYDNIAFDSHMHSAGTSIPRPLTRINPITNGGISPISEESSDNERHHPYRGYRVARDYDRKRNIRPQDTFQRDLARTIDQYRRSSMDNYRFSHM